MKLRPQARRLGRQPSAQVSEQEVQIRKGLESMREATAREVMTPRVDVVALAVPVTLDDVASAVLRSGHSHFPVYQDDLDHLLGVLFVKDLFHPGPSGYRGHPGRRGERRPRLASPRRREAGPRALHRS